MKKIVALSLTAICIALIFGVVIHNFVNTKPANPDSDLSITNSTLPEQQKKPEVEPEATEPKTNTSAPSTEAIVVPDDYPTIQQAVDGASFGDTVFVKKGQYNETVTISKSLLLLGEDKNSTIIDANSVGPDLLIIHDNVNVTGFTIRNTPAPPPNGSLPFTYTSFQTQKSGIEICNVSHCFIYENILEGNLRAVCIKNSSQIYVTRNEFGENYLCIELESSPNNYITHNFIDGHCGDFANGIIITSSTNNYVVNNTVTNSGAAIALNSASDNSLRDNKLTNNYMNFGVTGDNISSFMNDVDTSNTLDGKLIYYWIGKSNETVPSNAGCIILVNCNGITVQDFELVSSKHEIVLVNTNNSMINYNKIISTNRTKFELGDLKALDILVFSSFDNEFTNNYGNLDLNHSSYNRIAHNVGRVDLTNSNFNNITENNLLPICFLTSHKNRGVQLINSSHNRVEKNNITDFQFGIVITASSCNNLIIRNDIIGNDQGGIICEESPPSEGYNIIYNNTVTENGNVGICLQSHFTRVIYNNITGNRNWNMALGDSVSCYVMGNLIEGLEIGWFYGNNVQNCSVIGNTITATKLEQFRSIWLLSEYLGTFYHNNFLCPITIDNEVSHIWDNGNEGNYWRYHQGIDTNEDGISDVPYIIDENNQDNYALMEPVDIGAVPELLD